MIFVLNQSDELYEPTLNTDSSERPYQKKPLFFAPLYFAKFAFSEILCEPKIWAPAPYLLLIPHFIPRFCLFKFLI